MEGRERAKGPQKSSEYDSQEERNLNMGTDFFFLNEKSSYMVLKLMGRRGTGGILMRQGLYSIPFPDLNIQSWSECTHIHCGALQNAQDLNA